VSVRSFVPVRDAVILAAGNGDRFKDAHHHSKLLHPVLGQPLILRTLQSAADAGISRFIIILGYEADRVRDVITAHPVPGTTVCFVYNAAWQLENGVSALCARAVCAVDRFALLMADHLFDPAVLRRLTRVSADDRDCLLAIDDRSCSPTTAAEATKVRLSGDRIVQIGKDLDAWHALDTGLFVFTPALFDALDAAQRCGETTLSAGVQRLASHRRMRGVRIGDAAWYDVDTLDDLHAAESLLAARESDRL
jgi:1L-myo-inositol 1-phosphate cytidylyltransferase